MPRHRHVTTGQYWSARLFEQTQRVWRWLGKIESAVLREEIERTPIHRPIYVSGVPRSGTTILTELLARHPQVATHRYSDFPNVYTPYWRNWLAQRVETDTPPPQERAHRDRILVTRESPEAVEEVLWSAFFPRLHRSGCDQHLDRDTEHSGFEAFYQDHIRKLLRVRSRQRYLAKGNYNLTRIGYLKHLFTDARFIVPVRHPVHQIASLVKQHRLFQRMADEDIRVAAQLRRSGHHEFGPDRRAVTLASDADTLRIQSTWDSGDDVVGYALYWASLYRHVLSKIEVDQELAQAVLFLRYEDLCADPSNTLSRAMLHVGLDPDAIGSALKDAVGKISAPTYYTPRFSEDEFQKIRSITGTIAERFGYEPFSDSCG